MNGGAMLVTRAVAMHHRFDAANNSKASKSCCLHCNTDWCNQKAKFLQSSRKCCKAVITRAVCIYNTQDANQKQSSNALTLTLTLIFCTCLVSVAGFLASFAPVVSGAIFRCCARPGASFLLLRKQALPIFLFLFCNWRVVWREGYICFLLLLWFPCVFFCIFCCCGLLQ